MKKLSLILTCLSFVTTGCTSGYRVYINGYSELAQPIKPNASFYVESNDPNSHNPIFDQQIKNKIEALLEWYNYVPVSDINKSDYVITFRAGISSHEYHYYEPFYHTYLGFHTGFRSGYSFGYSTYIPYYDTYYDRWLSMRVSQNSGESGSNNEKVVWVGDAVISTSGGDLRRVINYLLVGSFDYFGVDTRKQKSVVITKNDPKILEIENIR